MSESNLSTTPTLDYVVIDFSSVTLGDIWTISSPESGTAFKDGSWTVSKAEPTEFVLPVYGLGSYVFPLVHGLALFSLGVSIIFSTGVLIYMLYPYRKLWTRPIGERLVVYLAACDLLFSISHSLDHGYMMATWNHPPDPVCSGFAFVLAELVLAQALIVLFTALNALCLVVMEKKIPTGRYDWGLLVYSLGPPTVFSSIFLGISYFGQSGPW